jgi:NAD(P)-dependent dehydrogenase (short-subunit alcohol dehydrogenase family)
VTPGPGPAERSDRGSRTVLVTGANSGIGLETALELARRGFHTVGSVRSTAKAAVVEQAASAEALEVETVLLDVTDAERCDQVLADLDLYGLVNNAGYALTGAIEDITDGEARQLFETMVFAPMRLARLALPAMRAGGDGRIVNVSSIAGLVSSPLAGWYTGAKHALEALTDALRIEVARDGIKVTLVEPGGFKTGIWEDMARDIERHEQAGSRNTPAYERSRQLQRLLEPIMGSPAGCARVIAGAVAGRSPRDRYLVGRDAQAIRLGDRLTPNAVQDRVLRLVLGL